jgi:hypothetical protein
MQRRSLGIGGRRSTGMVASISHQVRSPDLMCPFAGFTSSPESGLDVPNAQSASGMASGSTAANNARERLWISPSCLGREEVHYPLFSSLREESSLA